MRSLSPLKAAAPAAHHYAWLTAAFAAFALYGSLVPLQFRPLPWAETQKRWAKVCAQPIHVESRSDWAANILLFVPLGFLGMAALCVDRGRSADWWAVPTAAAWACFSAFLEFSQLYFPPRDSSINDIAAESLGAAVGIAVWIAAGRPLTRRAREAWAGRGARGTPVRLLAGYVVLLLVMQVFPPNLTISPVELYHRYKAGMVRPWPFAYWVLDPTAGVKKALEGTAWFLPLGLLAARVPRWREGGRAAWEVFILGLGTAAAAEFLRLFVVTHSCDATDVITNGMAVLGGWFAGLDARKSAFRRLAAGAWVVGLVYLNWLPFDFRFDGASWARWREISWLPFVDYLQASYLAEAQGVADKVMQFLVLGALLALAFRPSGTRGWAALLAAAGLLAVLFEGGQLFLPTRYTSLTDVLVETTSAGLGLMTWGRLRQAGASNPAPATAA